MGVIGGVEEAERDGGVSLMGLFGSNTHTDPHTHYTHAETDAENSNFKTVCGVI